ncbi:hypothetical protein OKW40_005718 [Paraburkholderia sp. RAU6.4a]
MGNHRSWRQFYELHVALPKALNTEAIERIGALHKNPGGDSGEYRVATRCALIRLQIIQHPTFFESSEAFPCARSLAAERC